MMFNDDLTVHVLTRKDEAEIGAVMMADIQRVGQIIREVRKGGT